MYTLLVTGDVPGAASYFNPLLRQTIIPCTSGARPASPAQGMTVAESDTGMYRGHNGTNWRSLVGFNPHVLLYKTTASIPNNTVTTINWSSEGRDRFGMWSSGSADLITIPYDGLWEVLLSVRYASQATVVGYRQVRIDVGGVEQNVFNLAPTTALNATNVVVTLAHPMAMTAGEQIQCKTFQNSGGALDIISPTRLLVRMVSEGSEVT